MTSIAASAMIRSKDVDMAVAHPLAQQDAQGHLRVLPREPPCGERWFRARERPD